MSEESPDARQKGAQDSAKKKIRRLEKFLEAKCPARVRDLIGQWQYETGQAPRKTKEYMEAIRAAGKIEFFENCNEDWVRLKNHGKPLERRFNVETMQTEMMPEEEDENATEYMRRRSKEKENRIRNELRQKLREKLSARLMTNE